MLDTFRAHTTVVYGLQVRSLSEETLKDALMEEVKAIQTHHRAVNKLPNAHKQPTAAIERHTML